MPLTRAVSAATIVLTFFLSVGGTLLSERAHADDPRQKIAKLCHDPKAGGLYAASYQQTQYMEEDPEGDYCLIRRVLLAKTRLTQTLTGKKSALNEKSARILEIRRELFSEPHILDALNVAEQEATQLDSQPEADSLSIIGRENPIRMDGFREMFAQVIREEAAAGVSPRVGSPLNWSPQTRIRFREHAEILSFSKTLVALAMGVSSRYLVSGYEESLMRWIVDQPHDSIRWDGLFRVAYRMTSGDIYLAVLTIENVLSRHWVESNRARRASTLRLTRMVNYYGSNLDDEDRFGSWYHFAGLLLYGYVKGSRNASIVGFIESMGSHVLGKFKSEPQEDWINAKAGKIGATLRTVVERQEYLGPNNPEALRVDRYLSLREDFRDRLPITNDPGFELLIRHDRVLLRSHHRTLTNCTIEIMEDNGRGVDSRFTRTIQNVTLKKGRLTHVTFTLSRLRGARAFISDCQEFRQTLEAPPEPKSDPAIETARLERVTDAIQRGLETVRQHQLRATSADQSALLGNWWSYMENDKSIPLLGSRGKSAIDYNAFVTATIVRLLAKAAIQDLSPEESKWIPDAVALGLQALEYYREGSTYGFWPLRPHPGDQRKHPNDPSRWRVARGPLFYPLESKFIIAASNVPTDADDTALVLSARHWASRLGPANFEAEQFGNILEAFERFRDHQRKNNHYYNVVHRMGSNTGAYLTWLYPERGFSPWMWIPSVPHDDSTKRYVPYGANEIDCVVNANVLASLAERNLMNEGDGLDGARNACQWINKMVEKKREARCGVYYPNAYQLHASIAHAWQAGARCLEPAVKTLTERTLKAQAQDGSWSAKKPRADPTHSTLYALELLLASDPIAHQKSIARGIDYLLSQELRSINPGHWAGEVFFAGGTVVRASLSWRSDAYTTARVVAVLASYRSAFSSETRETTRTERTSSE